MFIVTVFVLVSSSVNIKYSCFDLPCSGATKIHEIRNNTISIDTHSLWKLPKMLDERFYLT